MFSWRAESATNVRVCLVAFRKHRVLQAERTQALGLLPNRHVITGLSVGQIAGGDHVEEQDDGGWLG